MIDFHDITVRDQHWIEPILHAANKPGADYTFTSMLFWTNYYGQVGRVGDFVTQYLHWEGRNIYLFPAGQGDLRAAVDAVLDDSLWRGGQTRFRGVTAEAQAFLEEQYPGRFRFTPYRDSFDYIYTVEELCDIKTAVSEAVTNCIVHAYPDRIGEIYIAASLSESNLVTIKVRDHGCGIADVQKAMEPLFTTGDSERAGLGFAVMQELMDEVRVTSRAGGGTTVRLRRRLSQKAR